ncbi:hypothetical protein QKW35_04265 [Pontibacterium granulatum]|uniref:hypothetical protein n=1 Tax=Pontibacterium granulatum TaxID=2036029 RepID=UPI00249C02A4|nr:hypothetical protein [Pontibacterium granulatum]MDI3323585.1 hypothetical protein [Pontibacterium granulatum]
MALLVASMTLPAWAEVQPVPDPIPYDVTPATGSIVFAIEPAVAYKGLPRGTFDVEPMEEVRAYALPSTLPPPTVVPAADSEFYVQLNKLEKEGPTLSGEDLVFQTIADDRKKERCLVFGEECSALEIIEEGEP